MPGPRGVRITGAKAHSARLKRIASPAMVREAGKAIYVAADALRADAALSITEGAVSGANHVPSAPGEAPNADTHLLDRSIETTRTGPTTAEVSANAPHAIPQELGTSKMAARPFMGPAADRIRPKAQAFVRAAVARIAKGQKL
jgi:HK97 gp10 family phage protein